MPRPPRPWTVLLGLAAVVTAVVIAVLDRDVIRASHPAYGRLLAVIGLGGVAAIVVGLRLPVRRRRRLLGVIGAVAVLATLAATVWLRPLPVSDAGRAAQGSDAQVTVTASTREIALTPTTGRRETGLVFYPGAKVDPRAYVGIFRPIAAAGFPVVILRLPVGIAFGAPDAASRPIAANPSIPRWVVAGHSLGGTVAAAYAGAGHERVVGLVLWASYPARSIAGAAGLHALSVSASNDGLATPAKITASRPDLPPGTTFVEVVGAVHADFGDYGPQQGDGVPTISHAEAQRRIVAATLAFLRTIDAG